MLEKQLERALTLNPALKDEFGAGGTFTREMPSMGEQIDENMNQIA